MMIEIRLADEGATAELGADLALACGHGGLIFLQGDLGSGKTSLARGFVRTLCGPDTEVPSPTFTIVQEYDCPSGTGATILHADLYRIGDPSELAELGISESGAGRIVLVEWPERAGGTLGQPDIAVSLQEDGEGRIAILEGRAEWLAAIRRSLAIREFLDGAWGRHCMRRPLTGDASSRAYETVTLGGDQRILMNAPRRPDGPPIRNGLPYSRIAHLAEDVRAFAGVRNILADAGLTVPQIHAADFDQGLLLISDLGSKGIIGQDRQPISERYLACVEMLAGFHRNPCPGHVVLQDGTVHEIPLYDRGAMMIEVELLIEWYAPRMKGSALSVREKQRFAALWNRLFDRLEGAERHLVLRDFHSPNILWQEDLAGSARIGIIDFQDAVIGPLSYDVASLAQDARIDVPAGLEDAIVHHYLAQRRRSGPLDETAFLESYAIMAAQRATKILGIFVRLDERDGKPAYLGHLPRLRDYLARSFRHPVMEEYREWFASVMGL